MKEQRIGIVGGSGYIGSSLAEHLSKSFDVKVLDVAPLPDKLEGKVEYARCDIRDRDSTKRELSGLDLVIHTAIIQIPLINEQRRLGYEVNVIGTENICKAVEEDPGIKGMILAGTWHTIGERGVTGSVDETFGYRPDNVEDRARLYVLSKILQEGIVRFYDEISERVFGIIRMGTVLGEGMPEKTAANIFINRGLKKQPLTPYKHSMYRPMLYVDVGDVCSAFESFSTKILSGKIEKGGSSLYHIVNVVYPEPMTILELAETVRDVIRDLSNGEVCPRIEIVDKGLPRRFSQGDKNKFEIEVGMAKRFLGLTKLTRPAKSIEFIIRERLSRTRHALGSCRAL